MHSRVTQISSDLYSSKQIEHCATHLPVRARRIRGDAKVVWVGDIVIDAVKSTDPISLCEIVLIAGDIAATRSGSMSLKGAVCNAANAVSDNPRGTTPSCSESSISAS